MKSHVLSCWYEVCLVAKNLVVMVVAADGSRIYNNASIMICSFISAPIVFSRCIINPSKCICAWVSNKLIQGQIRLTPARKSFLRVQCS